MADTTRKHTHRPRVPEWMRARNATRAPAFRDDALEVGSCAYCAALDAALSEQLAPDLERLEREHGECSCFAL